MRLISLEDAGKITRAQIQDPPRGESSLHAFGRLFWKTIERRRFVDGMHLHAKCEALSAVHSGQIKKLIVNEPPNSTKSVMCNVIWPAYIWAEVDPGFAYAFASYDVNLVSRDARRFQELITSPLFRAAYPERFEVDTTQPILDFQNSERGHRFGTTPGRGFTGRHFDGHVYDDLIKPQSILEGVAAEHQTAIAEAMYWVREVASNRAQDAAKLWRVCIAQRLHEADPSGQLLDEGDWEHLCLPERYVPKAQWIVGGLSAKLDKRTEPGQLLWPERRGELAVAEAERNLRRPAAVAAQMQQNPAPSSGGVLHKEKIKRYLKRPPLDQCRIIASLDLAFKGDSVEQSRCAGSLWAQYDSKIYLLDAWAQHLDYAGAKARVRSERKKELWSKAQTWLIEDKANGPALQSDLAGELRLVACTPGNTDKVARMLPYVEPVHGGDVLFPDDTIAPWVEEVLSEICKVPRGSYDDLWDTMTQALTYLIYNTTSFSDVADAWDSIRDGL